MQVRTAFFSNIPQALVIQLAFDGMKMQTLCIGTRELGKELLEKASAYQCLLTH